MNKIIRSIPGKVTLIFLFVLCFATVVLSGFGAAFGYSNDLYVQTMEERIYEERMSDVKRGIHYYIFDIFGHYGYGYRYYENIGIAIYDNEGNLFR